MSVQTKPTNGIERRTTEFWCVGGDKIIEEVGNGKFNIVDWCRLDYQGLRRVHAVLGHMLTDLEHDPFAACNSVEIKPEF